ncbi:hypothetical protein [Amycolatopsis sp. H20-H5]|uniref:hypothetical protein n=1 Tax=Amycolatopsis sp. H20-H5 TaxID=3046309 RepID=UPI002DB663FD|nr:hypothetical protein [Amycolatopsis sp. H20-H5]MEC3980952.1 hypothetical protein [Amycolatopsis sp. H20-H5]
MTEQSLHAVQSAVVLDIGGDVGALVLYTGEEDDEAEIDISPGTDPAAPRTHNQVHPRRTRAGVVYSAVYPTLAEGEYTLWRDSDTPEATIVIRGGHVTEHHLSAPLGTSHTHSHGDHTHQHS